MKADLAQDTFLTVPNASVFLDNPPLFADVSGDGKPDLVLATAQDKVILPGKPTPKGMNWWKFWTFGLALLIFIWALGTLAPGDRNFTNFVVPFWGVVVILYLKVAIWLALWDFDRG